MRRKLSVDEKSALLAEVSATCVRKNLPKKYRDVLLSNILDPIIESLETVEIEESKIEEFCQKTKSMIYNSMIQAGEAVGILCAQSIGERQTQLSVEYDGVVMISEHKRMNPYPVKIGNLIDTLMNENEECLYHSIIHHDSQILNVESLNLFVCSIADNSGKVIMSKIYEVSRHPPNGDLIRVMTRSGYHIVTTRSHSHLQIIKDEIVPKLASDLRCGDVIPVYSEDGTMKLEMITGLNYIYEKEYCHRYVYDLSVENTENFCVNRIFVHNTLNSFHSAGLAIQTVVSGVPRFLELLNATKDPRISSNIFRLKNKKIKTPQDIRDIINHQLVSIKLVDLVSEISYFNEKDEEVWYGAFENVYSNDFREYQYGITIYLDKEKMFQYKIPIYLIKDKIENAYADVSVVFSPIYIGQVDIFVDVTDINFPAGDDVPSFFTPENYINVFLEDVVKTKIMEIPICGIENIVKYHIKLSENKGWVVETEGSNFLQITSLPFIDFSTISSTNMWDIYETFGIEAVREFLIQEFLNVVSSDGTFINLCHIYLLVDIMTYQGTINSISRYGMKKEQVGVLTRSSFEESLDQFCKAGYTSEKEPIHSVSAAIMVGKRCNMGTGLCSLKMDWDMLNRTNE